MVVNAKEGIKQEDLTKGVHNVQELDYEVGGDHVVAIETTTHQAAHLGQQMLGSHTAARPVVTLGQQITVELVDNVSYCLLTYLQVVGLYHVQIIICITCKPWEIVNDAFEQRAVQCSRAVSRITLLVVIT